jgi:hypothetical protein
LSDADVISYLSAGPPPDYTQQHLRRMRTKKLTAKKIDEIFDRTERGMARRRTTNPTESAESTLERDFAVARAYGAVELHSQLVRNLEFANRAAKLRHLKAGLQHWRMMLLGSLSAFHDVMAEMKEDIGEILMSPDNPKALPRRGSSEERIGKVGEVIDLIDSSIKCILPTMIADVAYHHLASEKLVDLMEEILNGFEEDDLTRMLVIFILLEIDPARALRRLSEWQKGLEGVRWAAAAVTQRLYVYYRTRPIAGAIREQFENLTADLELSINQTTSKQGKGRVLQELKKQAFRNDGAGAN